MADEMVDQRTIWTRLGLGFQVVKEAAVDALADDLFNVYGKVLIKLIIGECTGAGDGAVVSISLNEQADSLNLCAPTVVTSDAVGTIYVVTGDPTIILNGTANAPILKIGALLSAFQHNDIVFDGQAGLVIELTATNAADTTLAIKWELFYFPLEPGAYVEAAA